MNEINLIKKGRTIIVSGPSGTGKGTIVKTYLDEKPQNVKLSVSATTRSPRDGETNGVEYYFHTRESFEALIAADKMLEYTEFCGNLYGTPLDPVKEANENGVDVILEIEVVGAMNVKRLCEDAYMVFVMPPSAQELRRRLEKRGSETEDTIRKRLRRAAEEMELADKYDYILVNDDLNDAVEEFRSIISTFERNVEDKIDFVKGVQKDVKAICKRTCKKR